MCLGVKDTNMEDSDLEDEEEVEEIVSEISDEYDPTFDESTERLAGYGSLMVSLQIVSDRIESWTNASTLPTVEEIETQIDMVEEALEEAPTENLEPNSDNEFDERISKIVQYAEDLIEKVEQLKEARQAMDEIHREVVVSKQEFELLQDKN